jgi:GNAT superfamily N-acetyltransferase
MTNEMRSAMTATDEIEIRDGYHPSWAEDIFAIHNKTELKRSSLEKVNAAFLASFAVATCWQRGRLIGCGRMVSDGKMYASIFDVVIDPEFQKQGVGRKLLEQLISKASGMTIHLTSTFGNEGFYKRLGFRRHKTAMALYPSSMKRSPYLEADTEASRRDVTQTWTRGDLMVSTDKRRLDAEVIQKFLANSYWAKGIPMSTVVRSLEGSLCFGVYCGNTQIGFARVVSDLATFAYLADVFVIEEYRGRGISKWLMECILSHPDLQGLRQWLLGTRDAHRLYKQYGFAPLSKPERFMQINRPDIYLGNV